MELAHLQTKRLILRPWKSSDLESFAVMNADPKVMQFYSNPLFREESDALAHRIQNHIAERGYGFWAVELLETQAFIGYIGLNYWSLNASFAPCVDIGWRIASEYWGKGYATEGASEALRYGFEVIQLEEIVSMATLHNLRSRRVMEKLHMTYNPEENFYHPMMPREHPLALRVLYRLTESQWRSHAAI
ncbi:MAG: GNAT family N-acetyltransferase [Chlamydiae bacterium CG10_big_fil_rev_8_21_14_0_10_42_34]|nr:MAG: GNAT family N-acetyltransferase [Chlamydiae bacterium CG10_big_fil_rev_8_21_14_0_10_42_34]